MKDHLDRLSHLALKAKVDDVALAAFLDDERIRLAISNEMIQLRPPEAAYVAERLPTSLRACIKRYNPGRQRISALTWVRRHIGDLAHDQFLAPLAVRAKVSQDARAELLINQHVQKKVLAAHRNLRIHPQDVEDFDQNLRLKLLSSLEAFDPKKGMFLAWLNVMIDRFLIDARKRARKHQHQLDQLAELPSPSPLPEAYASAGELLAKFRILSPTTRSTLALIVSGQKPQGVKPETFKARKARARQDVRRIIGRHR